MTAPVEELKIRARLLRKALKAGDGAASARARRTAQRQGWQAPEDWTLAHCLNVVAAEAGFSHWNHASTVLCGESQPGSDMGSFWYDAACSGMLNHWFASYQDALEALGGGGRYLLPYGRQFIVVEAPFVVALGVDALSPQWERIGHDVVAGYGSEAWRTLVEQRLLRSRGR